MIFNIFCLHITKKKKEYDPVCCNGEEYSSPCSAEAAGKTDCYAGTCQDECHCTHKYIPVCCGNKTYGNICTAKCADEDLLLCDITDTNCINDYAVTNNYEPYAIAQIVAYEIYDEYLNDGFRHLLAKLYRRICATLNPKY